MAMFPWELIEGVRPGYFIGLLQGFPSYCATRALELDESRAYEDLGGWIRRLHRVINAPDPERPSALRVALRRVAHMSDREGHERLIGALQAERDALDAVLGERLTPLELALWAHKAQPAAFDHASRCKQLELTDSFWEFMPSARKPLAAGRPGTVTMLATRIADRYSSRGQADFGEIGIEPTKKTTRLLLMHGRASRALLTPERCDVALIDHRSGRLGLHVEDPYSADFFRRLLGEALYDNADHFNRCDIYSGRPLLEQGTASLSVAGIPVLQRVDLRGLRIEFARGGGRTFDSESCVFDHDADAIRDAAREPGAHVTEMKFAVVQAKDQRERILEIAGTNWIRMTKTIADTAVREFLVLRGFADYGTEWSLRKDAA